MVSVTHITSCMSEKEFQTANTNKRVEMIKKVYEEAIEKEYHPNWHENWIKSLPLVYELVNMQFHVTKLLHTETTWRTEGYNEQYINMEPIKHNAEFIKQILALQSIWESKEGLILERLGRRIDNEAIENSVQLFYKNYPEEGNYPDDSIIVNEEIRFLSMYRFPRVINNGGVNMRTKTDILEVLIY